MLVKNSRSVVVSFSLLLIFSQQSMLVADDASPGRRLAIVVGVNTYRPNQGLENLKQAVNDARELSRVLRDAGFKVIEMTHEAAKEPGKVQLAPNADFIRDQISGIVETPNLGRDDTILITLHGHGVQYDFVEVTKKDGKEITSVTPKLFFCPADASLLDSKGEKIQRANDLKERNHLVALDELYEQLGLCKSATKLLIVDACRNDPSSPLFRSADNEKLKSATMPKLAPPPGGIAAFFSCKANQRAVDDPELMHGVFTHYLIQGLQGKADLPLDNKPADGIVTLSELTTYVANNTYRYVFDKYGGLKQSPDIKGEFDANTPIVRKPLTEKLVSASTGMRFVRIPKGDFQMGNEVSVDELVKRFPEADSEWFEDAAERHSVQIERPFYLGKFEVTIGEFRKFVDATGYKTDAESQELGGGYDSKSKQMIQDRRFNWKNTGFDPEPTDRHPVVNVSWNDAVQFCNWLSSADKKTRYYDINADSVTHNTGTGYRLPTEAEWEYVCRAGSSTMFVTGDDPNDVMLKGNFGDLSAKSKLPFFENCPSVNDGFPFTSIGDTFGSNPFGVSDMHGNVREWCFDSWRKSYSAKDILRSGDSKVLRVNRGGAWSDLPVIGRSAMRNANKANHRSFDLGFRVAFDE